MQDEVTFHEVPPPNAEHYGPVFAIFNGEFDLGLHLTLCDIHGLRWVVLDIETGTYADTPTPVIADAKHWVAHNIDAYCQHFEDLREEHVF